MKRLSGWLTKLYPPEWRARYGEEFSALIEDAPPHWSTNLDLLKGAISMQLRVRNFPRLALILSTVGLLAGLGASYVVTPRFASTATLVLYSDSANEPVGRRMMEIQSEVLSRASLAHIMQDPRLELYQSERSHEPLEDVIETMRHNIRIETPRADSHYQPLTIRFIYADAMKTRATLQALLTRLMGQNEILRRKALIPVETQPEADRIQQLEARIALLERRLNMSPTIEPTGDRPVRPGGILLEVLDPPTLPVQPAWPNRSLFAATGFAAGLALALVLWIARRTIPPPVLA